MPLLEFQVIRSMYFQNLKDKKKIIKNNVSLQNDVTEKLDFRMKSIRFLKFKKPHVLNP